MRAIERYYKPGIKVQRSISVKNGIGGHTEQWNEHLNISGLIDAVSGDKSISAAKETERVTHILFCAVNDIQSSDRIVDQLGNIYRIKLVDNPMQMNSHMEILLEMVGHDQVSEQ
ncbi:hypothetical protein BHU72_12000 [Desulfuribacillus stibiiarsenatis]|uniref:Head-tail adaptor protein n=1 Tax=Desulfuribacillus stibiiarsenatis TaxID=1390249 RepID=A0A1E5L7X2_9FIRM|nr:phage head closure protein [Desulfuribacillus stibiiarsenatis]OEH86250.1 hypothetical protein BHU72_12000 [Desulfuribacillus stibiiarsenatis]